MTAMSGSSIRCGIVLAGGDGRRLQPFLHRFQRDALPKQYTNFIGGRSMLEHTLDRTEKLIPRHLIFTVVGRSHLDHAEVQRQLSRRPRSVFIVQPENRGTLPGILLPLMHLYRRYPESSVAVFPSVHFIAEEDEDLFMLYVSRAFRAVESDPSQLVMLGVEPDRLEPDFGYILSDGNDRRLESLGIRRVNSFVERPEPSVARELIQQGALWNTMVVAFRTRTLLDLVHVMAPKLFKTFHGILEAVGTFHLKERVDRAYEQMESLDFSTTILQALRPQLPWRLSVLPLREVLWSDWGSAQRVADGLKKNGFAASLQPDWDQHQYLETGNA
jgi:mannose-1-phosphate guanylyltransferase